MGFRMPQVRDIPFYENPRNNISVSARVLGQKCKYNVEKDRP